MEGAKKDCKKGYKKVLSIIGDIITVLLMILIIFLSYFVIKNIKTGATPSIFGHKFYIVLSGSMEPTFKTGSVIIDKEVNINELKEGDIITFKGSKDTFVTTHRIVKVNDDKELTFITKGDANNAEDHNPVAAKKVLGKMVFTIPYLGYVITFLRGKGGIFVLALFIGIMIIANEIPKIIKNKELKN